MTAPSMAVLLLALSRAAAEQSILDALRCVESGGADDCPDGDRGLSIGPFQITRGYWLDASESDPSLGGTYEDCRDRRYAERIVRSYMLRYVPRAWLELDAETIARTHNGGPRGVEKTSTLRYWRRVRVHLFPPALAKARPPMEPSCERQGRHHGDAGR